GRLKPLGERYYPSITDPRERYVDPLQRDQPQNRQTFLQFGAGEQLALLTALAIQEGRGLGMRGEGSFLNHSRGKLHQDATYWEKFPRIARAVADACKQ